eukprot:TRINITY_DN72483_c0_g1_i1.p1 TRINITY_DN72483_c0_g1~~TRINITY_DN72483_c0_g1_i1.p1  ORF type:complete len:323 (+),score=56.10 TRINITY_DN72483_c0_g1_i1:76-1044(+)
MMLIFALFLCIVAILLVVALLLVLQAQQRHGHPRVDAHPTNLIEEGRVAAREPFVQASPANWGDGQASPQLTSAAPPTAPIVTVRPPPPMPPAAGLSASGARRLTRGLPDSAEEAAAGSQEGAPSSATSSVMTMYSSHPASPTPASTPEDAEVKMDERRPTIHAESLEDEVTLWLEELADDERGDRSFAEWLHDGRVLCRAANAIQPGIVPKINDSGMPFKQMENVTAFIRACRQLGVLEKDVFSTVDLYEEKNLQSVKMCIYNLGSVVRRTAPTFRGPYLGVKQSGAVSDEKRKDQVVTQSSGFRQDIANELRDGHDKLRR